MLVDIPEDILEVSDFSALVEKIKSVPGYKQTTAFSIGIATIAADEEGRHVLLDCWYPVVNNVVDTDPTTGKWGAAGTAAILANALDHLNGTVTYELDDFDIEGTILEAYGPYWGEPGHPNIEAIEGILKAATEGNPLGPRHQRVFVSFIEDLNDAPFAGDPVEEGTPMDMRKAADLWHRLHQLSNRKVKPNEINLEGIFGLPNVVWTNDGPFLPDQIDRVRMELRTRGQYLTVEGPGDKFPRLLDYVTLPKTVRIADPNRVRLGAHLADGTTVMHEGFVNFNAGTLGKSMVEGRISAGVRVGDGSDIGGGASIMGTLSGGGKEVISIGERCLLGANSGIGISLGDDCIVEAGLYLTAGSKVTLLDANGKKIRVKKAVELSGQSGLLFRRNSKTGRIEVLPNTKAVELNPMLHA